MTDKEAIEFNEWAFGPDYFSIDGIGKMNKWNELHSEKSGVALDADGNILEDLCIMNIIWQYYKDKGRYPCQKD